MRRVLIGNVGSIARMGLVSLLSSEDHELVGDREAEGIIDRVYEFRPDIVLLDLDEDETPELAGTIASEFPSIKVIACSFEEPVMQVFPPFHHGESYVSELSQSLLARALKN